MPWLSLVVALIAFLGAKKGGASNAQAAALAGLAGTATYAVTHNTDWGKENLGSLDGVDEGTKPDTDGVVSTSTVKPSGSNPTSSTGVTGWLSGLGTFAPVAVGGALGAAATSVIPSWVWWVAGGLGVYLLLKD